MTAVTHGLGVDIDVIGGYSAFGFGIFELFPEGIVTQFGQIVYQELRDILIEEENRKIIVESIFDPILQEEVRNIEIQKANRISDIAELVRKILVEPVSRNIDNTRITDMLIFDIERQLVVDSENRICTIEKENRILNVEEIE
jgi:hypothetical protein